MIADWREAYRLHSTTYPELAYQATYGVRQGNVLPTKPTDGMARRARWRVTESKLLVAGLLSVLALGTSFALGERAQSLLAPGLSEPLYRTLVVAGLLLVELALLWWSGLQMIPTFLASRIVPTLDALPIDARTVDRAGLLLYLRLFDLPAAAVLVVTPIAVGLALGSTVAGLLIVPAAVSVVVFALALSLATGRFFLRRVLGAPGGSSASAALRWVYLLLWAIPAFAMYGFIALGPRLLGWLASLPASEASRAVDLLLAAYPFPLAALPFETGGGAAFPGQGPTQLAITASAALVYSALSALLISWLASAPRALARATPDATPGTARAAVLPARGPAASVLVKDLRIASRTPGYAFLILLPLLDAVAIGIWTVVGNAGPASAFNVAAAAVSTAALLATFFGPAFFAIEVIGYSYTRSLPVSERSVLLGKVALVTAVYAAAAGTVLAISLARLFAPGPFLAFLLAELPAVAAAALLEVSLLLLVARRRGLPITNLYTGSWWAAIVGLPGIVVAGLPLALFELGRGAGGYSGIATMASAAALELAAAGGLAMALTGGRR